MRHTPEIPPSIPSITSRKASNVKTLVLTSLDLSCLERVSTVPLSELANCDPFFAVIYPKLRIPELNYVN